MIAELPGGGGFYDVETGVIVEYNPGEGASGPAGTFPSITPVAEGVSVVEPPDGDPYYITWDGEHTTPPEWGLSSAGLTPAQAKAAGIPVKSAAGAAGKTGGMGGLAMLVIGGLLLFGMLRRA